MPSGKKRRVGANISVAKITSEETRRTDLSLCHYYDIATIQSSRFGESARESRYMVPFEESSVAEWVRRSLIDNDVTVSARYTEKYDGSGLTFGINWGRFYTSRYRYGHYDAYGDASSRLSAATEDAASMPPTYIVDPATYDKYPQLQYAKFAHMALSMHASALRTIGSFHCHVEVLYTCLPNSVIYPIGRDQMKIVLLCDERLSRVLLTKLKPVILADVPVAYSPDGKRIEYETRSIEVEFIENRIKVLSPAQICELGNVVDTTDPHPYARVKRLRKTYGAHLLSKLKPCSDAIVPEGYVLDFEFRDRSVKDKRLSGTGKHKLVSPSRAKKRISQHMLRVSASRSTGPVIKIVHSDFKTVRNLVWSFRNNLTKIVPSIKWVNDGKPMSVYGELRYRIGYAVGQPRLGTLKQASVDLCKTLDTRISNIQRVEMGSLCDAAIRRLELEYGRDLSRDYLSELSAYGPYTETHVEEIRRKNALASAQMHRRIAKIRDAIRKCNTLEDIYNIWRIR